MGPVIGMFHVCGSECDDNEDVVVLGRGCIVGLAQLRLSWYMISCWMWILLLSLYNMISSVWTEHLQMETHYKFKHLWGQELQENNRLFHVFRVWIWFECFMHFSNYRWKYSIFKPNRRDLIKNHRQSPLLKTPTTHLLFAASMAQLRVEAREKERKKD